MSWSEAPIGIAGAGRLGPALARILYDAGQPVVCIASRTPGRAAQAAALIGPKVEPLAYGDLAGRATRILIAVPDDALEGVAAQIGLRSGIALHTCGAKGAEALDALRRRGVSCGTLHPLQTVPDANEGARALDGAAFAISGDDCAIAWAACIAGLAHGRVLRVPDHARPLYHAAAVMASNHAVALMDAARQLMMQAGLEPEQALLALAPLIPPASRTHCASAPMQP